MYQVQSREPQWLTLIPASGKDKPARALLAPITRDAGRAAKKAGTAVVTADPNASAADVSDAMCAELIRQGLRGWDGIAGLDGKALPFTPANVEVFLSEDPLFEPAAKAYAGPWLLREAEKNGFSPSPTGTSAAATPARPTAPTAAKPAKPARTRSTPRKR